MVWSGWAFAFAVLFAVCLPSARAEDQGASLLEARKGHTTKLVRKVTDGDELVDPPAALFSKISYPGPLGKMAAYLGARPAAEGKYPAMLWITGGFPPGGIGADAWGPVDPTNDQTARAFREAGMVLMFPTLRGSFGSPGHQETFFGEVDDVLAAMEYLAKVDYVDPARIYLGGHSTGGTLALLVAAATGRFKAVFAFGPVEDPTSYGDEALTYDSADPKEVRLRAPIHYLGDIKSPTWVIEGDDGGNVESLRALQRASKNERIAFVPIRGANHFDLLSPVTKLIAARIVGLKAAEPVKVLPADMQTAFDGVKRAAREADDLESLARARRDGADLSVAHTTRHFLLSRNKEAFATAAKAAAAEGFAVGKVGAFKDNDGDPYYVLFVRKDVVLGDLPALFATSAALERIAAAHGLEYDGWRAEVAR